MRKDSFSIINDGLTALASCKNSGSLTEVLGQQIQRLGFERYAYLLTRADHYSKSTFVVSTYPEDWCTYYRNERYINIDPIVRQVETKLTPFQWAPLLNAHKPSNTQKRMVAEAADIGVLVGGTVPLRGPGECVAALTYSCYWKIDP